LRQAIALIRSVSPGGDRGHGDSQVNAQVPLGARRVPDAVPGVAEARRNAENRRIMRPVCRSGNIVAGPACAG